MRKTRTERHSEVHTAGIMNTSTSSSKTVILLFHLLLHGSCPSNCASSGAKACSGERYMNLRQKSSNCERCTERCSAEYKQVEVTSCTSAHNRVCHCQPGFFCIHENNYVTYCHKPCVPCVSGTFSSGPSLNSSCTPYTDCAQSGKIVLKEGTKTQDRECGHATTTPTILPTPNKIPIVNPRTTATTPSPSNTDFTTINAMTVPFIQTNKQERQYAMATPTISATPSKIIAALSRTKATTPSPSNTDFTPINAMMVPFIQTSNSHPLSHSSLEASPTHRMHSRSATGTISPTPEGNQQLQDSDRMSKDGLILLMLLMILMLLVAVFCILRKSTALKSKWKWTGFISGKHAITQLGRSVETEVPLCNEVLGQNMGVTSNSGGGQRVSMEHNVKGENVSNTVGSIYIYSPGTVILGTNSGDKKEGAEVEQEGVPLISPPQQESTPPSQEVKIRMSAQEEEATLSFPVPATGK